MSTLSSSTTPEPHHVDIVAEAPPAAAEQTDQENNTSTTIMNNTTNNTDTTDNNNNNNNNKKVIIYGTSGMVGRGVLEQCLIAPDVAECVAPVRRTLGITHDKLHEIIVPNGDLADDTYLSTLQGYDACFYCLGVSSGGMDDEEYRTITYDLTMSVARGLAANNNNPNMTFVYVSGAGTDGTEKGSTTWANVKGKVENDLKAMTAFNKVFAFRPAVIQPLDGVESQTAAYRWTYRVMTPLFPIIKWCAPNSILTTRSMGDAMLNAMRWAPSGSRTVCEVADIVALSQYNQQQQQQSDHNNNNI